MQPRPERVGPNTFRTFYPGAGRIAGFRRDDAVDTLHAEDWVGSVTTRAGQPELGLSLLADGSRLLDRVGAEPDGWFGPTETAVTDAPVLVKLLDAGARLPLHIHPDQAFAREHLASEHGKSEAWLVLHADLDATAHLGFARDVEAGELRDWVERQDVAALLGACHQVPLRTGDVVHCPGGVPHAIGDGVLMVEIQEPTDLSIMLEWEGHPLDPADSFLGLEVNTALGAVVRTGLDAAALEALRGLSIRSLAAGTPGVTELLPGAARSLLSAQQVVAAGDGVEVDRGFAVLVVNEGSGLLVAENADPIDVTAGETYVLPHALVAPSLHGHVAALRCAAGHGSRAE